MSASESNRSSPPGIPADSEIEKCIKSVVREAVQKDETVTVKLARTRVEERLGLEAGFLKDSTQWKQRSKDLIEAAFDAPPSPEAPEKAARAPKTKPVSVAGTKRKSDEAQRARKRQKKESENDEESEDAQSDYGEAKTSKHIAKTEAKSEDNSTLSYSREDDDEPEPKPQNGSTANKDDESELSSVVDDASPKKKRRKKAPAIKSGPTNPTNSKKTARARLPAADDESELSSIIDDPPPQKKARKKKSTSPNASTKPKTKSGKDLSPDEEEIKRLQSWLLKCGIRKLWHRELAPFPTNKGKIKHLKEMLEEAGMTGRFSAEKAKQIKEARELRAELEAATEFNQQWGHGSGDEDESEKDDGKDVDGKEEKPQPGKRLRPKGFVDFGDSDEESE